MEIDTRVELIRALIPLGLMFVGEILEEEVVALAGQRLERGGNYDRHGSNPGSVKLNDQSHPVRVSRVRLRAGNEVPLRSWQALRETGEPDELLLQRGLYGISCRNYEPAAEALPGAIGLSASRVSRSFIQASARQLKEFQERNLADLDLVALFLDGKTFAEDTMVIALRVDLQGRKIPLGFVQTGAENERALTPFLNGLLERELDISRGLLAIIDRSKGLRSAAGKAFGRNALVQRCQCHKRENVVSYLPKAEQDHWRRRLHKAYERPTYIEAKAALSSQRSELTLRNESAATSLDEGFEETLTLHRLGVFPHAGPELQDQKLSGITQRPGRGALRQGGPLVQQNPCAARKSTLSSVRSLVAQVAGRLRHRIGTVGGQCAQSLQEPAQALGVHGAGTARGGKQYGALPSAPARRNRAAVPEHDRRPARAAPAAGH